MRVRAVAEAEETARWFLHRSGVLAPEHLMLERWIAKLGIELVEAKLDGATAQLIRVGKRAQIVLPEHVTDRGARRFSIAHELYHFLKKHPSPTPTMLCTPRALRGDDESTHVHEIGANAFAGELLLPEFLVRARCEVERVDLDVVRAIARDFEMSNLSTAIRFTELASERCAAVFSANGAVVWATPSKSFKRDIASEIPRGTPIDPRSIASEFFRSGSLDERARFVPARAWFPTADDVEILEHSTCSRAHGTVLSMLWVPPAVAQQLVLS